MERELKGLIIQLELEETVGGEILLRCEMEGRRQYARVQLGVEDYHCACDAHRDGRGVRVRGYLEREGKQWRLVNPHDFQVVA